MVMKWGPSFVKTNNDLLLNLYHFNFIPFMSCYKMLPYVNSKPPMVSWISMTLVRNDVKLSMPHNVTPLATFRRFLLVSQYSTSDLPTTKPRYVRGGPRSSRYSIILLIQIIICWKTTKLVVLFTRKKQHIRYFINVYM